MIPAHCKHVSTETGVRLHARHCQVKLNSDVQLCPTELGTIDLSETVQPQATDFSHLVNVSLPLPLSCQETYCRR